LLAFRDVFLGQAIREISKVHKIFRKLSRTPFKWILQSVFFASLLDARRFKQHSQITRKIAELPVSAAQADLLRRMHSLEKGLALPAPSPGFGSEKAKGLIEQIDRYRKVHGHDWYVATCTGVLREYSQFQRDQGYTNAVVENYLAQEDSSFPGGSILIDRETVMATAKVDFAAFARSRHSIRNFEESPVSESDILSAIDIARRTPSVCNRNTGRVYFSTEAVDIQAALKLQGGTRGFSQAVPCLLVVASDVSAFYKLGERNQPWIDGGLFAMSLVYALHGLGLGTCMLNWSKSPGQDAGLRRAFQIAEHHNIIMMIAVGNIPNQVRVALSPRPELEHFQFRLQRRKS